MVPVRERVRLWATATVMRRLHRSQHGHRDSIPGLGLSGDGTSWDVSPAIWSRHPQRAHSVDGCHWLAASQTPRTQTPRKSLPDLAVRPVSHDSPGTPVKIRGVGFREGAQRHLRALPSRGISLPRAVNPRLQGSRVGGPVNAVPLPQLHRWELLNFRWYRAERVQELSPGQ